MKGLKFQRIWYDHQIDHVIDSQNDVVVQSWMFETRQNIHDSHALKSWLSFWQQLFLVLIKKKKTTWCFFNHLWSYVQLMTWSKLGTLNHNREFWKRLCNRNWQHFLVAYTCVLLHFCFERPFVLEHNRKALRRRRMVLNDLGGWVVATANIIYNDDDFE